MKNTSGGPAGADGARSCSLVLRTLKQAYYSPQNLGHAGLHSSAYRHFTSPIRRYPDIVCHRALLSAVGGGERAPRAPELLELGTWASEREREAMIIERDGDDIAACFALERMLFESGPDEVLDGEITGLIGAGAFVAFDGPGPGAEHSGTTRCRRSRACCRSGCCGRPNPRARAGWGRGSARAGAARSVARVSGSGRRAASGGS